MTLMTFTLEEYARSCLLMKRSKSPIAESAADWEGGGSSVREAGGAFACSVLAAGWPPAHAVWIDEKCDPPVSRLTPPAPGPAWSISAKGFFTSLT